MNEIIIAESERLEEFLESHYGEIKGIYEDKYYRNGGWNGMMDAIDEVVERYGFTYDSDLISDEFENIINRVFYNK